MSESWVAGLGGIYHRGIVTDMRFASCALNSQEPSPCPLPRTGRGNIRHHWRGDRATFRGSCYDGVANRGWRAATRTSGSGSLRRGARVSCESERAMAPKARRRGSAGGCRYCGWIGREDVALVGVELAQGAGGDEFYLEIVDRGRAGCVR